MIRLVSIGGTGDAYLTCALAGAVREKYGDDVTVVLKETYAAIPAMFGLPCDPRPVDEILGVERDAAMHREYDNQLAPDRIFYVHPCFTRSGVRIDRLTILPGPISQADMYRALLGLELDAPLALPRLPIPQPRPNVALLIPNAVSWPNTQLGFWISLQRALSAAGWETEANDWAWPLDELLHRVASAEMVVGPQCGVMSILAAARFPCRKVFATPSIDDGPGIHIAGHTLLRTYPYGYVRKFDGRDYDVEEYKVTDVNHDAVIAAITSAPRGSRDPRPVAAVEVSLSPGDFLDRLAVLIAKRARGLSVGREHARYIELCPPEWSGFLASLIDLHSETFDALQRTVPLALADARRDDHEAAALNRQRVEMTRAIDAELRGPYAEVRKSYHRV